MQRKANGAPPLGVGAWLRRLGLEQYEAAFRENEIDETWLRGRRPSDGSCNAGRDLGGLIDESLQNQGFASILRSAPRSVSETPGLVDRDTHPFPPHYII